MQSRAIPSPTANPRDARVRSVVWLVRCLLVLLLVFDQVSSPFHAHLHEGSAGMHQLAAAHKDSHDDAAAHALHDDDAHAASELHTLASHPILAIRAETARSTDATAAGDESNAVLPPNAGSIATLSSAHATASSRWRVRASPDIPFHLSLPPASRAPPLLA